MLSGDNTAVGFVRTLRVISDTGNPSMTNVSSTKISRTKVNYDD